MNVAITLVVVAVIYRLYSVLSAVQRRSSPTSCPQGVDNLVQSLTNQNLLLCNWLGVGSEVDHWYIWGFFVKGKAAGCHVGLCPWSGCVWIPETFRFGSEEVFWMHFEKLVCLGMIWHGRQIHRINISFCYYSYLLEVCFGVSEISNDLLKDNVVCRGCNLTLEYESAAQTYS